VYHGISYTVHSRTKGELTAIAHNCFGQLFSSKLNAKYGTLPDMEKIDIYINTTPFDIYRTHYGLDGKYIQGAWYKIVNKILGGKYFSNNLSGAGAALALSLNPSGLSFQQFKFALFLARQGFNNPFVGAHVLDIWPVSHTHPYFKDLVAYEKDKLPDRDTLWQWIVFLARHPGKEDEFCSWDAFHQLIPSYGKRGFYIPEKVMNLLSQPNTYSVSDSLGYWDGEEVHDECPLNAWFDKQEKPKLKSVTELGGTGEHSEMLKEKSELLLKQFEEFQEKFPLIKE
jgi:hypothetical protein